MSDSKTLVEGARHWASLTWLSEALFKLFGVWSVDGMDPKSAPMLSSLSRCFGEHVGWWQKLLPISELLDNTTIDPRSSFVTLMVALEATDSSERLAAAVAVIDSLEVDLLTLDAGLSGISDGPAKRVVMLVRADIGYWRPKGEGSGAPGHLVRALSDVRPLTG